jgi:branched-chain amino acid transport system permease protein
MDAFLHQVIAGLATGGIYASLALALVMIHNATRLVNFAQGEMAMFATYLCWTMLQAGWPYWGAFFATVVLSFVLGVAIERIVIRPVERAPVLTVVVVFIGLLLSSTAWPAGSTATRSSPSPAPSRAARPFGPHHRVGARTRARFGVTLVVLLLVYLFFRFTPLGLAMRAAAQNPDSSRLVGIRVGWMLALGWGLAAAIGATAGMMVAPIVFLEPNMMTGVILDAFARRCWAASTARRRGGRRLHRRRAGEHRGRLPDRHELKLTVALVLIVGVLVVKPAGLFGRVIVQRV